MSLGSRYFLLAVALTIALSTQPLVQGENSSSTYEHVEALTDFSPRLPGTQGENLAASYIEGTLENAGYENVLVDNFAVENAYLYHGGQLRVMEPVKRPIEFTPVIRSPPTENVLADNLVYVENTPENLARLSSDIVLVEMGNFDAVSGAPVEAFLIYEENRLASSIVAHAGELESPTVSISSKSAENLIELQENSQVRLRLRLDSELQTRTSQNVVATLSGEQDDTIVVSAHHDSVLTQGAIDDASGVAVLLEAAKELSDENLTKTVKFVSFGAEEYGLLGSRHYLNNINKQDIVGVLNLDSICPRPSGNLRVGIEGGSRFDSTPWLGEYVRTVAENLGIESSSGTFEEVQATSDYFDFVNKGISATWIYWASSRENFSLWPIHTSRDNLEYIDKDNFEANMESTLQVVTNSVVSLSGEDLGDWRWKHRLPGRISVFTILTSITVVLGIVVTGYTRYVQRRKGKKVILSTVFIVAAAIFTFYLLFLSGTVQVF